MKVSIFMKTYFDRGEKKERELSTYQEIQLDHLYNEEKETDENSRNEKLIKSGLVLNPNVVSREILDHIKETSNSEIEQDSEGAIGG